MQRASIQVVVSDSLTCALDQFIDYCRIKNLSGSTLGYYNDRLKLFLAFYRTRTDDQDIKAISVTDIRAYISHMISE